MAATYGRQFKETLLTCPFNKAHQIAPARMQMHLLRCKRSYPNTNLEVCLLNATHHIPADQLQYHMHYECPDRVVVEKEKFKIIEPKNNGDDFRKYVPVPNIDTGTHESGENWETDPEVITSYDPQKKLQDMNGPVFSIPQGKSKSERKAYRKEVKLRLADQAPGSVPSETELNSVGGKNDEINNKQETEEPAPLRRPKVPSQVFNPSMGMGRGRGRIAADIFGQSMPGEENNKGKKKISHTLGPPPGFEDFAPSANVPLSWGRSATSTQTLINIVRGRGKMIFPSDEEAKPGGKPNVVPQGGLSIMDVGLETRGLGDQDLHLKNLQLTGMRNNTE